MCYAVLRNDIAKIRHTTSEPCEHMFGNIRQADREFTCSEFSNHVDKQNRRFNLTFRSDLRMAKDDALRGYQETFSDFIESSKSEEHCTGPCQVGTSASAPVSLQIWPHVKHTLHACSDKSQPLMNLLEVKQEDRCVFFNKPGTIAALLNQFISTTPRAFSYNNMQGSDKDTPIEIEEEVGGDNDNNNGAGNVDSVVKRLQQFALDMKSEDNEESEDEDEVETATADITTDESNEPEDKNLNSEANPKKSNIKKSTLRKCEEIAARGESIMRNTLALLQCNRIGDLSELAITAISSIDNVERGSLNDCKKFKSFLGRWCEKTKLENAKEMHQSKEEKEKEKCNDLLVERDRIIACKIEMKVINEETKEEFKKDVIIKYRVLSVHTKRYNKWFMTEEKQTWNRFMKEEELKTYRCTIRMITDGAFEGYDDIPLVSNEWPRKHICKCILEIENVYDEMFNY